MNDLKVNTNAEKVYEHFQELTHKELGKALKTGLRKALKNIKNDTKKNLSSAFNNTNKKNPKFNDTLQEGVRTTRIYENYDGTLVGKARIDSNRKSGSGSFRLPILEKGNYKTSPRIAKTYKGKPLKKERKTGDIKGKDFFKNAVNTNGATFQSDMINEVNKAINKINNSK